jgi:hypothetical protein
MLKIKQNAISLDLRMGIETERVLQFNERTVLTTQAKIGEIAKTFAEANLRNTE